MNGLTMSLTQFSEVVRRKLIEYIKTSLPVLHSRTINKDMFKR